MVSVEGRKRMSKQAASQAPTARRMRRAMSFADYGRHQRVSYACVRGWAARGLVKLVRGGVVDVEASDELLAAYGCPQDGPPMGFLVEGADKPPAADERISDDPDAPLSRLQAEREIATYKVMAARLKYQRAAAAVVPVEDARRVWAEEVAHVRRVLLGLGARIAARLDEPRNTEQIKAVIEAEITVTLRRLVRDA